MWLKIFFEDIEDTSSFEVEPGKLKDPSEAINVCSHKILSVCCNLADNTRYNKDKS